MGILAVQLFTFPFLFGSSLLEPVICFFFPGDESFVFLECPRRPTPNPSPTTAAPTLSPGPFRIRLVNMGTVAALDGVVEQAAQRWERVIVNDLPDVAMDQFNVDMFDGFFSDRSLLEDVDDVTIGYEFTDLGTQAVFGQGGPLFVRLATGTTITGAMRFDYRFFLRQSEQTTINLVTHQIGHILGVGTRWRNGGCNDACVNGESNPLYECPAATTEAMNLGITPLLVGPDCLHFDEDSLSSRRRWSDVMTPLFRPRVPQLLTPVSVASLTDVGEYRVDLQAADPIPGTATSNLVQAEGEEESEGESDEGDEPLLDLSVGMPVTTEAIPLDV